MSGSFNPITKAFSSRTALGGVFGVVCAGVLALMSLTPSPAGAQAAATAASRPHVYLMRGLMNIFSLGMDQLAVQIANHGVEAVVYNHSVEDAVVAAGFWLLDEDWPNLGSMGGAKWMIAGRRRHDYHVVKRLNPRDALYDLGRLMFDLVGLDEVRL